MTFLDSDFSSSVSISYPGPLAIRASSATNLQNTEKLNKGIFCLPLYPDLKIKDLKRIVFNLKKILSN